uniref:Uncharacterized protein n=1 Tax=Mesocestoides corti TaxID=53468 RepID=A0A5K3FUV6_MESCO
MKLYEPSTRNPPQESSSTQLQEAQQAPKPGPIHRRGNDHVENSEGPSGSNTVTSMTTTAMNPDSKTREAL